MKQIKKTLCTMLVLPCLIPAAQAQDIPESQFSFQGWPYRQETECDDLPSSDAPEFAPIPEATVAPVVSPVPTVRPTANPGNSDSTVVVVQTI